MADTTKPDTRFTDQFNVNPNLKAENKLDENENPTGGSVNLRVGERNPLRVQWQDGPRGQEGTDELAEPNGAFVEDVLWAAYQRLEFFQNSKYASEHNAAAMRHIDLALSSLQARTQERQTRGVEGKHEV